MSSPAINFIPEYEETLIESTPKWESYTAQIARMSYDLTMAGKHTIPKDLRMCKDRVGKKIRYFINNFFKMLPDSRYLEFGSLNGATTCCAISNNRCKVTTINNYQIDNLEMAAMECNVKVALRNGIATVNHINHEFRDVDYISLIRHNVVSVKCNEIARDLFDILTYMQSAVDTEYLLIVHDYNQVECKQELYRALTTLNHTVTACVEIRTTIGGQFPTTWGENSDWHNGVFIGVITKPV